MIVWSPSTSGGPGLVSSSTRTWTEIPLAGRRPPGNLTLPVRTRSGSPIGTRFKCPQPDANPATNTASSNHRGFFFISFSKAMLDRIRPKSRQINHHELQRICCTTWYFPSLQHGMRAAIMACTPPPFLTKDPSMSATPNTLESLYCAAHKCRPEEFRSKAFWNCMYRHAIPLSPVLRVLKRGYFIPDQELVVHSQSDDHGADLGRDPPLFSDPKNQGWLRKRANLRISGQKVIEFSRKYLPPMPKPLITDR